MMRGLSVVPVFPARGAFRLVVSSLESSACSLNLGFLLQAGQYKGEYFAFFPFVLMLI